MSWMFSKAMMEDYESSRSLPELAEVYSEESCSDGEPYAQLNVMPTPQQFWRNDKMMDCSKLSRFGQTLQLLTESRGEELLTSFLEGFPAKMSQSLDQGMDLTENDPDCGQNLKGSFVKYDHFSSTWKTHQRSLLGDWDEYLETWPQWGSMRNGECLERLTLAQTTQDLESGYMPTPTVSTHKGASRKRYFGSKDYRGNFHEWIRNSETDPTCPNPDFIEEVMLWPPGWTELKPLAMDKFQQWLQQHGDCSQREQD